MPKPEPLRPLLLCYHFHPSPEVGAKRANALVSFLERATLRPIVVSTFEGLDRGNIAALTRLFPASTLIPVDESHQTLVGRIVATKQWLRRQVRGAHVSTVATPESIPTAATPARTNASFLYRMFFMALHLIDDKKGWSWKAARLAATAVRELNANVILASGPPMSALAAAIVAGRRSGIPVVVDFRDPCYFGPVSAEASWINRMDANLRKRFEAWIVRNAAAVVCTSPSLGDLLRTRYPKAASRVVCIPNGYDDAPTPPAPTDGKLNIVFAGALYVKRDPFPFLDALSDLLDTPGIDASRVTAVFVGECDSYRGIDLRTWLKDKAVGEVTRVLAKVPADALRGIYAEATVLLNLAQGQPMQIPAKTFEQLASGRELLIVCEPESDTAKLVRGIPGIHQIDGKDRAGMLSLLRDIYVRHVQQGATAAPTAAQISAFSREEQNRRLLHLLQQCASAGFSKESY